eukprot:3853512-Pyramimonas_sp.AAC.1
MSPLRSCRLRPWCTLERSTSPRCRGRECAPTSAGVPAVYQLQRPVHFNPEPCVGMAKMVSGGNASSSSFSS